MLRYCGVMWSTPWRPPENRATMCLLGMLNRIMNPSLKNRIAFQELLNVAGVKEYVSIFGYGV